MKSFLVFIGKKTRDVGSIQHPFTRYRIAGPGLEAVCRTNHTAVNICRVFTHPLNVTSISKYLMPFMTVGKLQNGLLAPINREVLTLLKVYFRQKLNFIKFLR
jgi:hypothetical protein